MMTEIAVLGLGAMGSRMARKLIEAGYRVVGYNRTPDNAGILEAEGVHFANSPREAAAQADIVISMVSDDAASRAIWLSPDSGAVHGLRPGSIVIESSTLSLQWIHDLGTVIRQHGAEFLDAPVAGSRPQAEAGQLIYFVGGSEQALERTREVLSTMGATVHHVGPNGSGIMMKLAVNAIFGIQVAAFAEMLGMLEKCGIAIKDTVQILNELPTTSPALKNVANQMAQQAFSPLFPIDLVEKDFRYVLEAAIGAGALVPTSNTVQEVFMNAKLQGYGEDNISGVVQLYTSESNEQRGRNQEGVSQSQVN
ncbi:NAD(P)-dependent oxidoreductase [Sulfuriflexus mobilis]|uniref:NAD(P)-dependent oxidoreductase n=1 Tax=Sulfuriflexus mobilis TaxID=1811807 RepID=UPI0018D56145|nr:NAD(P)-dependent oxidoreductase [Sulfuriflexus mobilis]